MLKYPVFNKRALTLRTVVTFDIKSTHTKYSTMSNSLYCQLGINV